MLSLQQSVDEMRTEEQSLIITKLKDAINPGDAADIDRALSLSLWNLENNKELQTAIIPVLIKALCNPNHYSHEDIVRSFQQAQDPRTIDVLYSAAINIPEYQVEYDGGAALARKCTWALADIGNEEAYYKLLLLAQHDNPEIASYAQKRITKWQEEIPRKAYQFYL